MILKLKIFIRFLVLAPLAISLIVLKELETRFPRLERLTKLAIALLMMGFLGLADLLSID